MHVSKATSILSNEEATCAEGVNNISPKQGQSQDYNGPTANIKSQDNTQQATAPKKSLLTHKKTRGNTQRDQTEKKRGI